MLTDIKEVKVNGIYKLKNGDRTRYFKVLEVGYVHRPGGILKENPFKGAIIVWYKEENEQLVPKVNPERGLKGVALPWVHLQNATFVEQQ